MKKFKIKVPTRIYLTFEFEADSLRSAIEKVANLDVDSIEGTEEFICYDAIDDWEILEVEK